MSQLSLLSIILGSSWASGINLYLTIAALGISHRFGWIALPGQLEILANPIIIILAMIVYLIEFVADKVPYVDSAWDSVHTLIRPLGAAAIVYFATTETAPLIQTAASVLGGTIALDSHLAKASTRVAINASPEPITNSVASLGEDGAVLGSIWLLIHHPGLLILCVLVFILLTLWLLPQMFRLFKGALLHLIGRGKNTKMSSKNQLNIGEET